MATALNVEPSLSTRRYSSSSSSTSSSANGLPTDAQASDDGWEDAEPDEEQVSIVSLFDDEVFPDVKSLLEHCRQKYDFDLLRVRKELGVYVFRFLIYMGLGAEGEDDADGGKTVNGTDDWVSQTLTFMALSSLLII